MYSILTNKNEDFLRRSNIYKNFYKNKDTHFNEVLIRGIKMKSRSLVGMNSKTLFIKKKGIIYDNK